MPEFLFRASAPLSLLAYYFTFSSETHQLAVIVITTDVRLVCDYRVLIGLLLANIFAYVHKRGRTFVIRVRRADACGSTELIAVLWS